MNESIIILPGEWTVYVFYVTFIQERTAYTSSIKRNYITSSWQIWIFPQSNRPVRSVMWCNM